MNIFGHLNVNDSDRVFSSTVGQDVIFGAAQEYLDRINADIQQATSVFIEGTTESFKERYMLPGGGTLQRRGPDGRYAAVKAAGSWDVAYPLEDFGAMLAGNDVDMAHMTVQELDVHIQNIVGQSVTTMRLELLGAILNNTQDSFTDPRRGTLLIEPLANGDATLYPPVAGSRVEATANHYLGSSYLAAAISDTNDPYEEITDKLESQFGSPTGGGEIAVFIAKAQRKLTQALAGFTPVKDIAITPGNNTATVNSLPLGLAANSGWKVLGRHDDGCWVVEWPHMPAGYMIGVHLEAPSPLKMRIDMADTGLGQGLMLVSNDDKYPFMESIWRNRFGLGVSNRLNGVVKDMTNADSDYDVPAGY